MNNFRSPDKSDVRFKDRILTCIKISVVALGCSAGPVLLAAPADSPPTAFGNGPEAVLAAGDQAYGESKFQDAVKLYTRAAKLGAAPGRAFFGRGMAHEMANQRDKAVEDYKRAIEADPGNYKAMENLAGIWERAGQHIADAIELYSRALNLDPRSEWQENLAVWIKILKTRLRPKDSSAVTCWHQGNHESLQGDLDSAKAAYSRAIALNPAMFQAYYSRGLTRMKQGDLARALKDFDEAIRLSPKLRGCLIQRGLVQEELGNKRAAMADFRRAVAVDPRDPQAFYQLGRFLEQEGNFEDALQLYQKAMLLKPKLDLQKVLLERTAAVTTARSVTRNAKPAGSKNLKKLW
jgi:tetratricopeptide (TPR) repeat protein